MKRIWGLIIIFSVSQLMSLAVCFLFMRHMDSIYLFYCMSAMILLTCLGDYCLYQIVNHVIIKNKEKTELEGLKELNKRNEQFYQYATLQQDNIRHFYHDIGNHLITADILKKDGKEEEYKNYIQNISDEFRKHVPEYETGNVMMDILIQYFLVQGTKVTIEGNVSENTDYVRLLEVLRDFTDNFHTYKIKVIFDEKIQIQYQSEAPENEKIQKIIAQYPEYCLLEVAL